MGIPLHQMEEQNHSTWSRAIGNVCQRFDANSCSGVEQAQRSKTDYLERRLAQRTLLDVPRMIEERQRELEALINERKAIEGKTAALKAKAERHRINQESQAKHASSRIQVFGTQQRHSKLQSLRDKVVSARKKIGVNQFFQPDDSENKDEYVAGYNPI